MDLNALRAAFRMDLSVRGLLALLRKPIGKSKSGAKSKKKEAKAAGADASPERVAEQTKAEVTPAQAIHSALRVVGIVMGIAIAIGAVPWWFGKRTEAAYETMLARVAGPFVTIKPVSYERGWFGSRAETEINFGGSVVHLTLASIIHHGPFPGFSKGAFTPRLGVIETEIVGRIVGLPQLINGKAHSEMSLNGKSQITVDLQDRDFDMASGTRITLRPLQGKVMISAEGDIQSEWKTPLLRLAASFGLLGAKDMALTLTRQNGKPGTTDMTIGALSYDTLDDSFRAEKLKVGFASPGAEQRIRLTSPELYFGTLAWGPGELEFAARRLDMRAIARFSGNISMPEKGKAKGKDKKPIAWGDALLELARTLAKQKTEIEIPTVSITTPQGEIGGQAKLSLATIASEANATSNPIHILRLSRANLELRVPGPVLRAYADERQRMRLDALRAGNTLKPEETAALTPERIATRIAEGSSAEVAQLANQWHLVAAPEGYALTLNIADGQMLINGVPKTYTVMPPAVPPPIAAR